MGTGFVLAIVMGMVALAVRSIIRDKKSGKTCSSCGGSCSGCSGCVGSVTGVDRS